MSKVCQICGKPSGMYPICRNCFALKAQGKVVKCDQCGKWHLVGSPCDCIPAVSKPVSEPAPEKSAGEPPTPKCIVCGKDSNGYLFCKSCFFKYRNKSLLLKVTGCREIEILDESYEGLYVCRDGHVVKSKSERDIDNYFFENKIAHAYEKALTIDGETFHPDFFLPEKRIYVEHWGYDESNAEYTRMKQYKLAKYEAARITLICTHEKTDAKDMEAALDRKLARFEEGRINYLDD